MAMAKKCLALYAVLVLLCKCAYSVDPSAHKCCKSGLLYAKLCTADNGHEEPTDLHCEHGSYTISPELSAGDNFTTDTNGNLIFIDSQIAVPYNGYCVGKTISEMTNITVDVAKVCFVLPDNSLFILKGILTLISVIFICATLIVYKIIPTLRETQDKVTICCISCLALTFTFLVFVQIFPGEIESSICFVLSILIYFFLISYFSWVNVVTANVFKVTLLPSWMIRERTWYILNHIYAWSIPIILTAILITCQHLDIDLHPAIGHSSCWIGESTQWLYVSIPIGIMITINIIQFCCIAHYLYKSANLLSSSKKEALKYKCQMYLKLFIMSGLTWIFEVLSMILKDWEKYWLLTDIVNALNGVIIFAVLVVFRKRVRKELGGKKICCWRIPQEWKKIGDTEVCEPSEETRHEVPNINGHRNQNEIEE